MLRTQKTAQLNGLEFVKRNNKLKVSTLSGLTQI